MSKKNSFYFLPIGITVGGFFVTLALWAALVANEHAKIYSATRLEADKVEIKISSEIKTRILALMRMASLWETRGAPLQAHWEIDAELYLKHFAGFQAIAWVDPEFSVRWVVPREGNENVLGFNMSLEPTSLAALKMASDRRKTIITHSMNLMAGEKGFLMYSPIFRNHEPEGYVVGVFRAETILGLILKEEASAGYSVVILDGKEVIYRRADTGPAPDDRWEVTEDVDLYGIPWTIRLWPRREQLQSLRSPLPEVAGILGLILTALLSFSIYQVRVARARSRELARSNADLEQFAYVASHDLREPLRKIISFTQILSERYKDRLDETGQKYMGYVVDGALRMQDLVHDLLVYSRAGKVDLKFETVDMAELLKEVAGNLAATIEESRAEVHWNGLPAVSANRAQMVQLWQNLLSNAVKFQRPGESPVVTVSSEPAKHGWLFAVKDNGIGIERQHWDKIFAMFQRLHTRSEYPGTGVGLSICKKIVERHGGRIWLDSEPGRGSTFYFTLPER